MLANLAERADTLNYACPTMSEQPGIRITEGRHPVVEQVLSEPFISNPLTLSPQRRMLIITGPNMGGKSTYMRQTALIVLMAHIGSYVPATKATIGPVDRIFTRVGAADDLASGRSTFMVEMTETANILHNATEHSPVLMDEIGRGTSTYDGLSLAGPAPRTRQPHQGDDAVRHPLLRADDPAGENGRRGQRASGRARTWRYHRLHAQRAGRCRQQSYGTAVAALAGVPRDVIKRARQKLRELESISSHTASGSVDATQMTLLQEDTSPAVEAPRRWIRIPCRRAVRWNGSTS